ncbi:hypothetical protein RIR_jg32181.t1 [Rhizophagus irregularis DAOM 181602=DAOM 197198]|nr:hypothetical protein RIR_jg32181.t1 [Rhizophagus irregularis DAOM 181602=DAOM 197198]
MFHIQPLTKKFLRLDLLKYNSSNEEGWFWLLEKEEAHFGLNNDLVLYNFVPVLLSVVEGDQAGTYVFKEVRVRPGDG